MIKATSYELDFFLLEGKVAYAQFYICLGVTFTGPQTLSLDTLVTPTLLHEVGNWEPAFKGI